MSNTSRVFLVAICVVGLTGCATEKSRSLPVPRADSSAVPYQGPRSPIAVDKFDNRSSYLRGIFTDNVDRLSGQAKTILVTHLQQSNRFTVVDRDNLRETSREAKYAQTTQAIQGARYVVTGDVTEFGRKQTGDRQLFGLLGRGKSQLAYAKVSLNIVDVDTSRVVFSVQGAGEYQLDNREVLGFGGTASYDATLNGKVLDLAIREAVNRLVTGIDSGTWKP